MLVLTNRSQWPRAHAFSSSRLADVTLPNLSIVGKVWFDSGRVWRPRFVSCLSALAPGREDARVDAYLDWAVAAGFNGIRVFGGELHWDELPRPQKIGDVYARLPRLLTAASQRGLAVEVCVITDSLIGGYDTDAHVQRVAEIVRPHKAHVILDLGQEVGHETQAGHVTPDYLRAAGDRFCGDLLWAVGSTGDELAAPDDGGGYDGHGGRYIVGHTRREADLLRMARRRKEGHDVSERYDAPYASNEPIGASNVARIGSRANEPWLFFAFGAFDWLFAGGGTHHNQAGLDIVVPSGAELECTRAYLQGYAIARDHLGEHALPTFINSGDSGALTTNGDGAPAFEDRGFEGGASGPFVRIYSFLAGDRGMAIALHVPADYPTVTHWDAEQVAHLNAEWSIDVVMPYGHVSVLKAMR